MAVIGQKRTLENSMSKLDEGQLLKASSEVVAAAMQLANGQIKFIDGIRKVAGLRTLVTEDNHDPDFMLFVAIDSESDHLPGAEQREHCAPAWLARCDQESHELETFWIDQVQAACTVLVTRFSMM